MRGGDISNEVAPGLGVRFERVIKTEEGKLNRSIKGHLQAVARDTDANIYIITTGTQRKALQFCMKWGIPFNRVIEADSLLEIPDIVRENDMATYYDFDRDILQNVNSRGSGKVKAQEWISVEVL